MAYRYGNREQCSLLPPCIDDYVGPDDPVRAYDAFVDALDLNTLGITVDEEQVGCPQYDPRTMLKLFVYGYSYGADRSSRKLERAIHHNLSFIWLLGGLRPDHKTIANFRRQNKDALAQVLKQSARMCLKLGLIDGNILFVDGTKIRANASIKNTWNQKRIDEKLRKVDRKIEALLRECEQIDGQEEHEASLVKLREELQDQEKLREKVKQIASELQSSERQSINTTDADCVSTKSTHGSYSGYNSQIVVDEKNGLIASCDVVSKSTDQGLLSGQILKAEEVLDKKCTVAVADAGYSDLEDLTKITDDVTVLVPVKRKNNDVENFSYNESTNTYHCPEGHILSQYTVDNEKKRYRYKISDAAHCHECCCFGTCTTSKYGRTLGRLFFEATSQQVEQNLAADEPVGVYKLRAQRVEHPLVIYERRMLSLRSFLMRGVKGVGAEMSLYASVFNVRRMITLLGGVSPFIAAVRS
jgi:transposase